MNKKAITNYFLVATLLSGSLILPGCILLGPNYKRPETPVPATWKVSGKEGNRVDFEKAETVLSGKWWTLFNAPELNELIEKALRSNQNLKSAAARVIQARAIARVTGADLLPSVNGIPSYSRFQQSGNRFVTSGFDQPSGILSNSFNLPLDLSYEVDVWGRVRRLFESSRAQAAASFEDYRTILLTLTSDIAQNYIAIRSLDQELIILDETKELRERGLAVVNDRFRAGLVSELDLARAKTELASVEVETVDFNRRRAELVNALALLVGEPASTFDLGPEPVEIIPPQIPAGLPSTLLERRPDVLSAENKLRAANAEIGVAQAAFFPAIRLTGSFGYESVELDTLIRGDSQFWSYGPGITLPIFLGGRNFANLKAAKAKYEENVANYRQQILTAFKEVEDAIVNIRYRDDQIHAQEKLLEAAKEAASLSIGRYKEGLVNFLEVVDAERSRLEAETARVQFKNQRLISTVLLIKALGGGWENVPELNLVATPSE